MQISRLAPPELLDFSQDFCKAEPCGSRFIIEKIATLHDRFSISYFREGNRVEYFITSEESKDEVSFSLVFCHDLFARQLHVSKFYPGLFRQPRNRYLSAACFFLLVNHSIELFRLENDQAIFLQCRKKVYEDFYAQLSDFNFAITRSGQGENVDVMSPCPPLRDLDTTMIIKLKALPI